MKKEVRVLCQFALVVLLALSCLAPAMACMVPNARMSTEERACCRVMKNLCGEMGNMPASHGCCHKVPPSVLDNALDTKAASFHPSVDSAVGLAAFELLNPLSTVLEWNQHPDYSPPKSPPSAVSVLRI
jgi:hypothetical protein